MVDNKQEVYIWAALGVVAIVLGIYFISENLNNSATLSTVDVNVPKSSLVEEASGFGPGIQTGANYAKIKTEYADRRIQIENCVLTPTEQTYKNNTKVMLDNRSADPLELKIDGKIVRLWDWEYKIFTFSSNQLPHTVDIDCITQDQPAYNVGRILLQP